MGRKCCVFQCRGNYDEENKERTFRFPKDQEERARWVASIPRSNVPDGPDTVVCERHWPKDYPTTKVHGKDRPSEPPSVFNCVKPSLVPTPPPPKRTTVKVSARHSQPDQLAEFNENDRVNDLSELLNLPSSDLNIINSEFTVFLHDRQLSISSVHYVPETGIPLFLLRLNDDFTFDAFHCGVKMSISFLSQNRVTKLNRLSLIEEAIRFLSSAEISHKQEVVHQLFDSMGVTYVGNKKYSTESITRAFEYFSISRSLYERLRQDFELPSRSTLTRLTSRVKSLDDFTFMKTIFSNLPERQKDCVLLLDEVYVKSILQLHGGHIFGRAVNNPQLLANTILSFMIVSFYGGPKFLCKMLPVKNLDAEFLYEQSTLIIDSVTEIGASIKAVICDGNRVNQSFYKMFEQGVDPWRTKSGLFLLFDYVHLLKSVRNNWITEATQELQFKDSVDGVIHTAKWAHLKKLQRLESNQLVKMSRLSEISVCPKPIERQKVSTCLQVFCEETCSALKSHPDLGESQAQGTIILIERLVQFWNIVNVHTPFLHIRTRNPDRSVIRSPDDVNLKKLIDMSTMIESMFPKIGTSHKRFKSLTLDTASNFYHTCRGLVDLAVFLLESNHEFVMLGNFTTDPLEKAFGKLRQGSGGTYFITVQQVLEKVAIQKTKLLLRLTDSVDVGVSGHSCNLCVLAMTEETCLLFDSLSSYEEKLSIDAKMALIYIAGYIVKGQHICDDDTFFYFEELGDFTVQLDRGGLTKPGDRVCQWVFYGYILFIQTSERVCRSSLRDLLFNVSEFYHLQMELSHCVTYANILLNNYCLFKSPRSIKEPKLKVLKLS